MNPRSGAMRNAVFIVAVGAALVAGCSRTGSTAADSSFRCRPA